MLKIIVTMQYHNLGKEGNAPALNLDVQVAKKLVELSKGSDRNITCNQFFTSVCLFEELHKDNLTVVGAVMHNKKQFLLALLPKQAKGGEIGSSIFLFKDNFNKISWYHKRSKYAVLLLSLHHNAKITFYNRTGETKQVEML